MKASAPRAASELGVFDRFDVMAGRADWVWADYVAEGYRQFDAMFAAANTKMSPAWEIERRRNARAWAETNCPPNKRRAA